MVWAEVITDERELQSESDLLRILSKHSYLQLLASRKWKLPIQKYKVEVTTTTRTRIQLLQKIVMEVARDYGIKEIEDFSQLTQIDELFIQDIINELLFFNVLTIDDGIIRLNQLGIKQLEEGTTLSEPSTKTINFYYDEHYERVITIDHENQLISQDDSIEDYRYLNYAESIDGKILNENELLEVIDDGKILWEIGNQKIEIFDIQPLQLTQQLFAKCYEYVLYDTVADKIVLYVWNGISQSWDERLAKRISDNEINELNQEFRETITSREKEQIIKDIEANSQDNNDNKPFHSEVFRGKDIRPEFVKSFKNASRKMLIASPWINDSAVNKELIEEIKQFAEQYKALYISWGYNKTIEEDIKNRYPRQELLDTLNNITSPDNTKAVFIRWFGNQHIKQIVVDQSYYLGGSFNFLSYRGDYNVRDEETHKTNDQVRIDDTTNFIESKFITSLKEELNDYTNNQIIDERMLVNWMKELMMLDSNIEERKKMSNCLMRYLKENNQSRIINQIQYLWNKYDCMDFYD